MVLSAIIGFKIAETLGSYLLTKILDKTFSDKEDFISKLGTVINATINEYREQYQVSTFKDRYPFYESEKIVQVLLQYRIMKDNDTLLKLQNAFDDEKNIITPKKNEIECFYKLFIKNVKSDPTLKQIEISETFGEEIFNISNKLDELSLSVENILSEIHTPLDQEWQRQIDVYKESINSFKPKTALNLLIQLEESFDVNSKKPSKSVRATIEFFKAQCYELIGGKENAYKAYIKAANLLPTSKKFKVQACISYFKIMDFKYAKKLVDEIFSEDNFNSVAWAISILMAESSDLETLISNVPIFVRKDKDFRRIIFYNTCVNEKYYNALSTLEKYSIIPDVNDYCAKTFDISSFKDKIFWFQCKFLVYRITTNIYFDRIYSENDELLKFIEQITSELLEKLSGSEIFENYTILKFINKYSHFMLNGSRDAVLEMKIIFPSLINKDHYFTIILANSLQMIGETDEALKIIRNYGLYCSELQHLESYCYLKKDDITNYLRISKEILLSTKSINESNILNTLNIIHGYFVYGKLDEIGNLDYVDEFESPYLKTLLNVFIQILKNNHSSFTLEDLQSIENEVFEKNPKVYSFIPYSFFLLKEYDLAINAFNKYLSKDAQSNDLLTYIRCLKSSLSNHKELLNILAKWRKEFSFNEELLRMEADLRIKLHDWDNCLDIAEYFLSKISHDESFLTLKLVALNELERPNKEHLIKELAFVFETFDFIYYINAREASRVLLENGFYKAALEILYKWAIDSNNHDARLDYIWFMVKLPEGLICEKDIVDDNCFVKYSLNGELKFIDTSRELPLAKELLGHVKGEFISVSHPYSKSMDSIQILRIMDKYLYLHDHIFAEVDSNPYSGSHMHSVNFNSEKISDDLISLFGDGGSEKKECQERAFVEYYGNIISFTELINQNYSSDYLVGYFHLVEFKSGITVIPLNKYPKIDLNGNFEFVIDFSSLLILFQIQSQHQIKFKHKFIIAKSIVDTIKKYLKNEQLEPKTEMVLNITHDQVESVIKSEEEKESNLIYLRKLLMWIELNCTETIVESTLDIIMKLSDKFMGEKINEYLIDNVALTIDKENRILITDDSVYLGIIPIQSSKVISTELYVKSTVDHLTPCIEEFKKNKYIGITL